MWNYKSLLPVFTILALSSCSKINDMHDATMDMDSRMADMQKDMQDVDNKTSQLDAQTTQVAAQTQQVVGLTAQVKDLTEELAQLTENLGQTTQSTYEDLRQGNSVTLRAYALKQMTKAKAVEEKLSFAGIYMQAYEFQLWKGTGMDDQTVLQGLYYQAFIEFFKDVREFEDGSYNLDPTSTSMTNEDLYAIAATMHEVNQNAVELDTTNNTPQVSILSLIKDTLAKEKDVNSGKIAWNSLQQYEQEILSNEKDAVYLLRLRENFLPIMTLSQLSNLEYEGFIAKLANFLLGITPDFTALNLSQVYTYTTWIQDANTTHDYLVANGYDPMINWKLAHLYAPLKMPDTSTLAEPRKDAMNAFIQQIQIFQKYPASSK
jgi:hypothetical protein